MKRMVPNAVGRAGGAPEAGGAVPEARAEWRRGRPRGAAATGDASVSASVRSVASVLIDGRLPTLVSDRNTGQDRSHDGFWRSLTGAQRERSVLAVRERAGSAAEGWADKKLVEAIKRRLCRYRTTTPTTKRVRERERERRERERERERERRERERREREPQLGSRGFVPVPLRRAGGKDIEHSAGQRRLSLSGRAHKAGRGHEALVLVFLGFFRFFRFF